MLSRQQNDKTSRKQSICSCSFINSQNLQPEEGNILISNPKQVSSLRNNQFNRPFFKQRQSFIKPKTSLKASKVVKGKENTIYLVAQEENISQANLNKGMKMAVSNTQYASQPINDSSNTEKHQKTSPFFKRFFPQIEKTVCFGRYNNAEQISQNQQTEKRFPFNSKAKQIPSIDNQLTNRTFDLPMRCKDSLLAQQLIDGNLLAIKFRTEKEISQPNITDYYSYQQLQTDKSKQMGQLSQQRTPILLKKKTTKNFRFIQRLQYKDTQSINQSDSVQVSQIISDIDDFQQNQNQSQKNLARITTLNQFIKQRYSRMTLFEETHQF